MGMVECCCDEWSFQVLLSPQGESCRLADGDSFGRQQRRGLVANVGQVFLGHACENYAREPFLLGAGGHA